MSETIKKLNRLSNSESFIQVNTIKGFKYIDKAGEIVNKYHIKNTAPQFMMGLEGLVIKQPKDKIDQLKITSETIWMKFTKIDSLDMILNLFVQETGQILSILEVDKISRVGWRNHFIFESVNKKKQQEYFERLSTIKGTKFFFGMLDVAINKNFKANLTLQPVVKNDENKTPGVLFDIDVFKTGEIKSDDILKILKDFRKYLSDKDGFLRIINNTFLKS